MAGLPDPAAFVAGPAVADVAGTRAFAARVADILRGGEVILLHGPLGAGKTCFVQGVCEALGITDEVTSPTFTLANRYQGRLVVHHLDFYRIEADANLDDIGVEAVLDEVAAGEAVVFVEWPLLIVPLVPRHIELLVLPGSAPGSRTWHLRGVPTLPPAWQDLAAAGRGAAGGGSC